MAWLYVFAYNRPKAAPGAKTSDVQRSEVELCFQQYELEGGEHQGIVHFSVFSSVRANVVSSESVCLSGPSPVSLLVVISVCYLLVPCVSRE